MEATRITDNEEWARHRVEGFLARLEELPEAARDDRHYAHYKRLFEDPRGDYPRLLTVLIYAECWLAIYIDPPEDPEAAVLAASPNDELGLQSSAFEVYGVRAEHVKRIRLRNGLRVEDGRPITTPTAVERACILLGELPRDEWFASADLLRKAERQGISKSTLGRARQLVGAQGKRSDGRLWLLIPT